MIPSIFPSKAYPELSDEEWVDYCIKVWCNNSLNAQGGYYRHLLWGEPNKSDFLIPRRNVESVAVLFERAQAVINYLLMKMEDDNNAD